MLRVDAVQKPLMLSRRQLLVGAAVLGTASALPKRLLAAMALHSFKHGDFEVTVMTDGHLLLPANVMAPDAPPEELAALLKAAGMGTEEVQVAASPVLVRAGSDLILFDTGSGAEFQPTVGKLEANLKEAGIDPGAITKVVFTHAHPDHAFGTLTEAGLRYPNASFYVAGAEWDFWQDPELKSKMPAEMHAFVDGAQKHLTGIKDKVTMVKPGDEIVSGLSVLDTAGHTPGHVSFEFAGGDGFILVGDAIASPAVGFPHPDWRFGFDGIPELAIENRKKLLDKAAGGKMLMLGFHWPYPGIGYAERKDAAYRFVPA
jgi:glyoxylase-like metal-dependent hydrolase (beta-lactamase superfamily II)